MKNLICKYLNDKYLKMKYSATREERRIKNSFLNYFDGCYGFPLESGIPNTYKMGVCKLEYKKKRRELIVYLRRPGLLIGEKGKIINDLSTYLDCKISIREVNLLKF